MRPSCTILPLRTHCGAKRGAATADALVCARRSPRLCPPVIALPAPWSLQNRLLHGPALRPSEPRAVSAPGPSRPRDARRAAARPPRRLLNRERLSSLDEYVCARFPRAAPHTHARANTVTAWSVVSSVAHPLRARPVSPHFSTCPTTLSRCTPLSPPCSRNRTLWCRQ